MREQGLWPRFAKHAKVGHPSRIVESAIALNKPGQRVNEGYAELRQSLKKRRVFHQLEESPSIHTSVVFERSTDFANYERSPSFGVADNSGQL